MSTEAIDRTRKGVSKDDRNERAQIAVKVFRQMQYGLSSYARAITGNPAVRVEVDSGDPRTDGTVIYYRPPIELGDRTPHDRFYCDKRDDHGLLICPACKTREEVLVNIYHEIAHIAFGSFTPTSDSDKAAAIKEAIREWGGKYAQRIEHNIRNAPQSVAGTYLGLTNLISPFLPSLFNCLEDARVDMSMFEARKGTRKMLEADTLNLLRDGVPDAAGNRHRLSEAPLNAQVTLACYLAVTGYKGWEQMIHPKVAGDMLYPPLADTLAAIKQADDVRTIYSLSFTVLAQLRELGYLLAPEEEPQDEQPSDEPDPETEEGSGEDSSESEPGESDDSSDDSSEPEADAGGSEGDDSDAGGASEPEGGSASEEPAAEGGSDQQDGAESDSEAPEQDAAPEDGAGGKAGDGDSESEGAGGDADGDQGDPDGEAQDGADAGGDSEVPGDPQGEEGSGGVDASDRDPVSDGAGGSEGPADQSGSEVSSSPDGDTESPPEGADGEPDEAAEGSSGGGDQESEAEASGSDTSGDREVESGDGGSSDADAGDEHREGSPELDGDRGDSGTEASPERGPEDHGQDEGDASPEAGPNSDEAGSLDDTEGSGERDDARREEGPERNEGGPDEVLDSGADKGEGGIETPLPEKGTVEDVNAAVAEVGHEAIEAKAAEKSEAEDARDLAAILTAIVQGQYFETPSAGVAHVEEHKYSPYNLGWAQAQGLDLRSLVYHGIKADLDIPETILGPSLLKTRRVFSDNKTAARQRNLKSGRINNRTLGKRAWSGDDRLFHKKRLPGKKDYAVLISMDVSSSNKGSNLALLKRSVMAQAELLHRAGIDFAIVAHSANSGGPRGFTMHLHHIKEWDQPWDDKAKEALDGLAYNGGNLDGHAMEYMRKSVSKRSATDKIILYYTDGKMPAANHDEELEVLIHQIQLCKRDNITLSGVGMQTDSPVRHGLDTVQVDTDEDIPAVVDHLGKRLLARAR